MANTKLYLLFLSVCLLFQLGISSKLDSYKRMIFLMEGNLELLQIEQKSTRRAKKYGLTGWFEHDFAIGHIKGEVVGKLSKVLKYQQWLNRTKKKDIIGSVDRVNSKIMDLGSRKIPKTFEVII